MKDEPDSKEETARHNMQVTGCVFGVLLSAVGLVPLELLIAAEAMDKPKLPFTKVFETRIVPMAKRIAVALPLGGIIGAFTGRLMSKRRANPSHDAGGWEPQP